MRRYFELVEAETFILEIDDEDGSFSAIDYRDAHIAAKTANVHANIRESVRWFDETRLFHLTVVGDEGQTGPHGIYKGWYVARWISEDLARKFHKSWGVLGKQPEFNYPSTFSRSSNGSPSFVFVQGCSRSESRRTVRNSLAMSPHDSNGE
jgi:hypothetical protein